MYYPRCLVYKCTHSNPFTGNEKYCSIPLKVTFAIRSPFPRSSVTVFRYTTKAISTWNEGGGKKKIKSLQQNKNVSSQRPRIYLAA